MRLQMGGTQNGVGLDCVVLVPVGQSNSFNSTYGSTGDVEGCNPQGLGTGGGATPGAPGGASCSDADVNDSGQVDISDIGQLIGAFGTMNAALNVTGDNEISIADIGVAIGCFGETV